MPDKIYTRGDLINELCPHDEQCIGKKKELAEKFNATYGEGHCLCSIETITARGKLNFAIDETLRARDAEWLACLPKDDEIVNVMQLAFKNEILKKIKAFNGSKTD